MNTLSDRTFSWAAVGMLSAFLLLPGCGQELERAGTEVLEQTYQVDPAARLRISNLKGSISIHGADTTELKLRATKTTANAAQLQDINISVAAETGSVSISTSVLPRKRSPRGGAGTVDYVLVVPRTVNITGVELEEGKVLIEGMEGEDVRANVVDGQLAVLGLLRRYSRQRWQWRPGSLLPGLRAAALFRGRCPAHPW